MVLICKTSSFVFQVCVCVYITRHTEEELVFEVFFFIVFVAVDLVAWKMILYDLRIVDSIDSYDWFTGMATATT